MKKRLSIILLLLGSIFTVKAQTWTTQITTNNSSESAFKLIKTIDGGFVTILNGVDNINNFPQNIIYNKIALVKLDTNGNIVFNKKINIKDSTQVRINDFIELSNGEFIISGGMLEKTDSGQISSLLIKTNALGDTVWTIKNIGNIGACNSYLGCPNLINFNNKFWTLDAIFTGAFDTLSNFIYEYDYNGNLLNTNYTDTFLLATSTPPPKMYKDINDSVFVVADWKGEGFASKKIDTLFNKYALNQSLGTPVSTVSGDGSLLVPAGSGDMYNVTGRLDSIWFHPFSEYEFSWGAGTSQNVTKIKPTADGGYVFIGNTWNGIVDNIYLIKTDAFGNKVFDEMYWSVTSHNTDVVQANDGGYVMLNRGAGVGTWIVKTDQNGIIGIDENIFFKNEVTLYPNPAKNALTLKFNKPITAQISIYTITGQQVLNEQLENSQTYKTNINNLKNGIYIVNIKTNNNLITKKLIINH